MATLPLRASVSAPARWRTLHQASPPKRWGGPRRPWRAGPREVLSPESDYVTAVDRQSGATKATLATAPEQPWRSPTMLTSCCEEQGGVETVGRQPLPLQGTENNTNQPVVSVRSPHWLHSLPRAHWDRPPPRLGAPPPARGRNRGRRIGGRRVRGGQKSAKALPLTRAECIPALLRGDIGHTQQGRVSNPTLAQISNKADICLSTCLSPASSFSAGSGVRWGNEGCYALAPYTPLLACGPGTLALDKE